VVEDFGLSRLSLWDQGLIQDIEDILADLLELGLDLLTVVADSRNMLIGTLGLFLLLDRRDYAPGSTSSTNDVLVGNRQKVSLVNGEFSAQLHHALSALNYYNVVGYVERVAYLGNLLHVCNHLIVTLGLLAEPCEEGLAVNELVGRSDRCLEPKDKLNRTFHAIRRYKGQ
jgi:hypothetical protein